MLENAFTWLSIVAGLAAAGLWLKAALVKISPAPPQDGYYEGGLMWEEDGKTYSIGRTFLAANKWNACAAGTTAIAVLLQAGAQLAHLYKC
jgi:hypothetical protein